MIFALPNLPGVSNNNGRNTAGINARWMMTLHYNSYGHKDAAKLTMIMAFMVVQVGMASVPLQIFIMLSMPLILCAKEMWLTQALQILLV